MRYGRGYIKPPLGRRMTLGHPQASGVVLDLLLNEGAGVRANDLSPHGNHGAIVGGTWAGGTDGTVLTLNGTTDYISVPRRSSIEPSELTVAMMMKVDTLKTNGGIAKLFTAASQPYYSYCLYTNVVGETVFNINNGTEYVAIVSAEGATAAGIWYIHIGRFKKPDIKQFLYNVDAGTMVMTGTETSNFDISYYATDLLIGDLPLFADCEFDGQIAFVVLWDRALSDSEIAAFCSVPYARYTRR